jgi:uncharacterized DUF497 family protein
MRDHYDFSNARRNPYAKGLKEQTIRIEEVAIDYFKAIANEAASVFSDEDALLASDPDCPENTDWLVLLGTSSRLRLVVVRCVYSEAEAIIHLASSRVANQQEHEAYARSIDP